jgi:5-methyltetrahydrofolate corrinoid/iron sulfur protein methyltransferase
MIFIGERINGGFKDIKQAILDKNGAVIQEWAKKQADAKANYIDVNIGTASSDPQDYCWMIEQVQQAVDTPISIDNNKIEMFQAALPVCKKPPLLNSVPAIDEKMDALFPLIAKYNASVICLVMDEDGSPKSADKRLENAGKVLAKAMDYGIEPDKIFLDPIIMPVKFMQDQGKEILKACAQFQLLSDPHPHIVCGLSNASNGTTQKKLINRTLAAMMVANGLDAIICNVTDTELVDAILTAELIMNRFIYADSYVEAFHK